MPKLSQFCLRDSVRPFAIVTWESAQLSSFFAQILSSAPTPPDRFVLPQNRPIHPVAKRPLSHDKRKNEFASWRRAFQDSLAPWQCLPRIDSQDDVVAAQTFRSEDISSEGLICLGEYIPAYSMPCSFSSTNRIIFDAGTPRAWASLKITRMVGWLTPRSIRLTKFRSTPAANASCSCERPASRRSARRT